VTAIAVEMEWTDTGAVVSYKKSPDARDLFLNCPRCSAAIKPNVEHRCGDAVKKLAKRTRKGPAHA
jgi:hypothetical protein